MAGTVTAADWDVDVLSAAETVIVAVCSPTGSPCRDFLPIVDAVAADLRGAARLVVLNIDVNPSVARRYDISSLPTLLVFRGGHLTGRLVGGRSKDRLLAELSPYLG